MKLAILLLCHINPNQVKMFVKAMKHPDVTIFIHVDKKCQMDFTEIVDERIILLPDELRCDVRWAQISQVEASLKLLQYAKKTEDFDFFWLCSGQDFPIKNVNYILNYLENNKECNFINFTESYNYNLGCQNNYDKRNSVLFFKWMTSRKKIVRIIKRLYIELTGGYKKTFKICLRKNVLNLKFYFGSQWWCLNEKTVTWLLNYLDTNKEYHRYFIHCLCPDESYFQTLVMNSPYNDLCVNYLHYIDWSEGKHSPKTLGSNDIKKLLDSSMLMARKFDINYDIEIFHQLISQISKND